MSYRPIKAQNTSNLLKNHTSLQRLVERAAAMDQLQQLLHQFLQPAARAHCHLASYQDATLTLIVTDGQWATRLRYQQKRLLEQLRSLTEFSQAVRIQFKVRPSSMPAQPAKRSIELSEQAGDVIQSSAAAISDPKLREALERLAQHAKK